MADTYTQFVVSIDNVSTTGKAWAEQAYPALRFYPEKEANDPPQTWTMQTNSDLSPDLDELIDFAQAYLQECDPAGVVTVEWANSCSKMRPDGFGGGADVHVVDDSSVRGLRPRRKAVGGELAGRQHDGVSGLLV